VNNDSQLSNTIADMSRRELAFCFGRIPVTSAETTKMCGFIHQVLTSTSWQIGNANLV
jgi:hypothetical protein